MSRLRAFLAAERLAAAVDNVRVLRQCTAATGDMWLTNADIERVKDADAEWSVARAGNFGSMSEQEFSTVLQAMRRRERCL